MGEPSTPIRVLVAVDANARRAGICDLVAGEPGLDLVGAAADAQEAIDRAGELKPDIALLDASMPRGGAARAAAGIAVASPGTRSIAVSGNDDPASAFELLAAGTVAYLVKEVEAVEIVEAIKRAARDQSSLPSRLVAGLAAGLSRPPESLVEGLLESAPDAAVISDREGRIVLVNDETEELFGYPRAELLGQQIEILLPERERSDHVGHRSAYVAHPVKRVMNSGLALSGRRKDGFEFPIDVSLSTVNVGERDLVVAFVRDATVRQAHEEMERELAERRAVLRHVVSAGEKERRQLAADIHDDSIQVMTAAGMRLQILRRLLEEPKQLVALDELEETIRLAIARLRRLIFELRPPTLDEEGLGATLHMYLEEIADDAGAAFRFEGRLTNEPPEPSRTVLYRIAQEVLANARRHSGAGTFSVRLTERDGGYHVQIEDDGVGFTPNLADPGPGHLGLASIHERAELAGGWLRIESEPGQGTKVQYWLPGDSPGEPGAGAVTPRTGTRRASAADPAS